jgi:3-phosphoshikimate 1-carboxyvinyltransferase
MHILESLLNLINMKNYIIIKNKISPFRSVMNIDGDKSLSIRWALLASQANGKSKSINLLNSEDVLSTLNCLKKLGVKVKNNKNYCIIHGVGINGFKYKENITLDAGNSGTLGRLILGLLVHSKKKIRLIGDKSLSKRDFLRVINPLKRIGASFKSKNGKLPITIQGTQKPRAINYVENRGSAQCKSSIMLAALNTYGHTKIKAKKSRNHTELLFKYLKIPLQLREKKKYDFIKIRKVNKIRPINYRIPADISSSTFFIVLATLVDGSKLKIKNVNINPSRTGAIKILRLMGAKIWVNNKKIYKGEKIGDINVESCNSLKAIKCPVKYNSTSIDEFLVIFLIAAKSKGISYFKNISELNQKESPRLKWGSKILNLMGVKTITTSDSIKIYGNPSLKINKKIIIKSFLKDHRVFMTSVIAALAFGGEWIVHDKNSIQTSFPSFLKNIKKLKKASK